MAVTVTFTSCTLNGVSCTDKTAYLDHTIQNNDGTKCQRGQCTLEYSTLTADEKAKWDAFWTLCCDKAKTASGV